MSTARIGNSDIARYSHDGKLLWVTRYMEMFGDPSIRIQRQTVNATPRRRVAGDYDGDGRADLVTFA